MNKHPDEQNSFRFSQDLNVKLVLEAEGKKGEIFSNGLEKIKLDLHIYGYEANVDFSIFDQEEIHELISSEKVINATLTFTSTDPKKEGTPLLEIKGIVYERPCIEQRKGAQGKKIRKYQIRFADPAKRSWNAHFRTKVFVGQTMKDVIDAEKNPLISLKYDWEELNKVSPIIAFSLKKRGLPKSQWVSFYSFLMWYLELAGGVFEYNYNENSYSILGKKSETGKPVNVAEWETRLFKSDPPEKERYHEQIIKHSAENDDHEDKENPHGFPGVTEDAFDDAEGHRYPEKIKKAILSPSTLEKHLISFNLARFLDPFDLSQITPGVLIAIKGEEKLGGLWSEAAEIKDQTFRLRDVSFVATKPIVSQWIKQPVQPFDLEVRITAESKDEPYIDRPEFKEPVYPFQIEGKIFCETGDKEQTAYNYAKSDKNPKGVYQVIVPRAGKDKKVIVPFTPHGESSNEHFPLTKDVEVMLAMYFQTAKIVEVIEFNNLVLPPPDTQIQQKVWASNGKDKFIREKQEFKGQENNFSIEHSTTADQKQILEITEQKILITVLEKGKNVAMVEINRQPLGLTLQVKDEEKGSTQQAVLTPAGIVLTSEGKEGKTTTTLTPDSVAIETKKFEIKCEEGVLEAKKTLTFKAGSEINNDAPITKAKKFKAN
jgi:hypothetical protein